MKTFQLTICRLILVLVAAFVSATATNAQTTTFTYQGRLSDGAQAANGTYDLGFALFDAAAGGTQIGTAQTRAAVGISNGIFTVQLDFGSSAFASGANRFLEIAVKRPADSTFTTLTPRQQLTSSPFSIQSLSAKAADGLSANCVACVTNAQINSVDGTKVTGTVASATNAATATAAGNVTGVVAIANGGTGSATQSFVDLTTTQTVAGAKTFSSAVNTDAQYNIGGSRVLGIGGADNLFAGVNTGAANTGSQNSFVGASAGQANTTGEFNSFVGARTGLNNTTGTNNSFIGANAGQSNTTGGSNSFVGQGAGFSNTSSSNNSFFGASAGLSNTAGSTNSFVGAFAGQNNTTGDGNSFFGAFAGLNGSTGSDNAFFGARTGLNNTTGESNSFFGALAGNGNTTGENNLFVGTVAGGNNGAASNNSFVGAFTGNINTASNNSFFGAFTGNSNTTGAQNSFVGVSAGNNNTSGEQNSFTGASVGLNNSTGSNNAFVGAFAGSSNTTGSNNTLIGRGANVIGSALTFATAIGSGATVGASNTVVLGRTADTVVAPNLLQVNALGAAGSTSLCRNAANQISTCTAGNRAEQLQEDAATAKALREQKAHIERQQREINELKAVVCSLKPDATVCK